MTDVDAVMEEFRDAAGEIRGVVDSTPTELDGSNPSGETRKAADVQADDLLLDRLGSLDAVGEYASEERETVVDSGEGELSVTLDPLDGSSNLDTNNVVGSILGVYRDSLPAGGDAVVAAAYVVYGPRTTVLETRGDEVRETTLETGETRTVELPEPYVYGFGGRRPSWTDGFREYAGEVESELKLRYGGAMVGDVNQVVHKGGVFAYPALEDRPEGKLRLQFEGVPMAYVVEAAGGASTDGERSLLDIEPVELHQRTPVYLGNEELIERAEQKV